MVSTICPQATVAVNFVTNAADSLTENLLNDDGKYRSTGEIVSEAIISGVAGSLDGFPFSSEVFTAKNGKKAFFKHLAREYASNSVGDFFKNIYVDLWLDRLT